MVFRKNLRRRRAARKGKKMLRKRTSKRNPNNIGGPNTCKVIETMPAVAIPNNTPVLVNKLGITGPRASAIAKEFGLYRIARVSFTYRPIWDTYSPGIVSPGSTPAAVPHLYWKINRYGDVPAGFNGDYMRALGARAFRLDDKSVKFSYKPSILYQQNNSAGATTSAVKITPWLSTDDTPADNLFTLSTAVHYGHALFIEGAAAGAGTGNVALMDVQVVYEFKNPRLVTSSSSSAVQLGDLSGNNLVVGSLQNLNV